MLFIGVDGGGTNTVACLARRDEPRLVPLGRGVSGPSNLMTTEGDAALRNVGEAIGAAFQDAGMTRTQVESLCAALAGSDREPIRERVRQWAIAEQIAHSTNVVHDAEPLLAEVDRSSHAVALIAGTGSFAFGRTADGRTGRAGGWGPTLGDEGSAYWMGLESLRWLSQVIDGRSDRTMMFERIEQSLTLDDRQDLAARVSKMNRQSIAALAQIVDQSAAQGDPHAGEICASAARHLTEIVSAVLNQLEVPPSEFALVVTGGVLLNRSIVSTRFRECLPEVGLIPTSISRCDDPAWGAVLLASSIQRT